MTVPPSYLFYSPCHARGFINVSKVFTDNSLILRDGQMRVSIFPEIFSYPSELKENNKL